jgi:hypothetical protein
MTTVKELPKLVDLVKQSKAKIKVDGSNLTDQSDIEGSEGSEDLFLIETDRDRKQVTISLSTTSKVSIYPDPDFRQVVVVTAEPERSITRSLSRVEQLNRWERERSDRWVRDNFRNRLIRGRGFPVSLPRENTTYEVADLKVKRNENFPDTYVVTATVTATVQATELCFLVGHDESAMFVSMLPKTVRSVKSAHNALRPPGVPKDAPRVGEFFFIPATKAASNRLDRQMADLRRPHEWFEDWCIDSVESENHLANSIFDKFGGAQYAIGWVLDEDKRHSPLFLGEWHRIERNLEVMPPEHMQDGNAWD